MNLYLSNTVNSFKPLSNKYDIIRNDEKIATILLRLKQQRFGKRHTMKGCFYNYV